MTGRKRRNLRPEEEDLWKKVAKGATPLGHPRTKLGLSLDDDAPIAPKAKPGAKPAKAPTPGVKPPIKPFSIGQKNRGQTGPQALLSGEEGPRAAVRMDRRSYDRLKRGKLRPEGRLDLHGMTLDQAKPALTGFILNAHAAGKRLVLVITGKGKHREDTGPIPERVGVLKRQVPLWLGQAPLKSAILQISAAHVSHGGDGAYYVYLARRR